METEDVTQQVVPSIDSQVSRNVQAVDEGARGSEFPKLLFVVILPRFKLDICLYPLVSASNLWMPYIVLYRILYFCTYWPYFSVLVVVLRTQITPVSMLYLLVRSQVVYFAVQLAHREAFSELILLVVLSTFKKKIESKKKIKIFLRFFYNFVFLTYAAVFRTVPLVCSQSVGLLEERLAPRRNLPPLLLKLSEIAPEKLDYLGVSYGMTSELLR